MTISRFFSQFIMDLEAIRGCIFRIKNIQKKNSNKHTKLPENNYFLKIFVLLAGQESMDQKQLLKLLLIFVQNIHQSKTNVSSQVHNKVKFAQISQEEKDRKYGKKSHLIHEMKINKNLSNSISGNIYLAAISNNLLRSMINYFIIIYFWAYSMECNYIWEEDELKKKRRRKYRDGVYTLTYPTDKIREMHFQTSEEISTFLLRNALEIGYCKWQLFEKSVVDKGDYIKIVYTCRKQYCDAQLIYHQKKPEQSKDSKTPLKKYFLAEVKINNQHRHVLKLTPKIANQQNIRQYLFDLPVQEKFQNHVQVIKERFNLSKCQAKYLKDRVFWRFKNEDHMLRKLTERKVTFRRKIQNDSTTILLLLSETMKQNYIKYGDILCFDITYKLLKKKKGQTRHLGVGFFVGQDQNSRILLYGLSTITNESSENFMLLFQYFFECVETIPQTILTDDQRALGYAIERLRKQKNYSYVHLLDWYHKMDNMKRAVMKQQYRDELFTLFCRLLKEPSKKVFKDIVEEIASMLSRPQIMIQFLREQDRYCLSQAPGRFFAFGISSTRAEAFNSLIKKSVPHQTNIGRLIYFVLRVEKRLINRMNVLNYINQELLRNILDPQVLILARHLQHLAWQQVRQYYQQSRELELVDGCCLSQEIDPEYLSQRIHVSTHKYIKYSKYERTYTFNLFYDIRYNCWRCQCKNNFRTGMPCCHLVKAIREYGGCISYYINERWFHDKNGAAIKKPSRPKLRKKHI